MASFVEREVNVFLKNDGSISEVKMGRDKIHQGYAYAVVVKFFNNKLVRLRLYSAKNQKILENFDTSEGTINAFEHVCSYEGPSNFSGDFDILKEFFKNNVEKEKLSKEEKTEIKKFMYLNYIDAKNKKML